MSTYRKEWPCCGDVTETEAWEPEHCPFCATPPAAEQQPLDIEKERAEFEAWGRREQYDLRRPNKTYVNTATSYAWQGWLAKASTRATQPAVTGEAGGDGWKLMPPEMDNAMQAAFEAINNSINSGEMQAIYRSMFEAVKAAGQGGEDASLTDEQKQELAYAEWEQHTERLRAKYPGIAGGFNLFEVLITTELDCKVEDGEYGIAITRVINGAVGKGDFQMVAEAIADEINEMKLPEEGQTAVTVYESGEREDVFWNKYYRVAAIAAKGANNG